MRSSAEVGHHRTRRELRFLRRGRPVRVADFAPTETLLDHLRLRERRLGTKEGCAEGDCGACTVALGRLRDGRVVYEPVNACITLLGQADGAEIVTVEDLAQGAELHPVQHAMVEHHGSQCGFCTPGIVMSLFALHERGEGAPTRGRIDEALAGNLCRCTGYKPITDAAASAGHTPPCGHGAADPATIARELSALAGGEDLFCGNEGGFFAAPGSEDALAELLLRHPDARILAGATDVGLWVTKELREIEKIVWLGLIAELSTIEEDRATLSLGATVSLSSARAALARLHPDLDELLRRFGSEQIRASGTVGGNIANGSPIGDLPPALIALGASLELRRGGETRRMPLADFFLDYRKQDRLPGEFVRRIDVPKLKPDEFFFAEKITKRRDEDISAVMMACRFVIEERRVAEATIACGGMAGIPKRASASEAALRGALLDDPASLEPALAALARDFSPMSDHRASAGYRAAAARALLRRAFARAGGTARADLPATPVPPTDPEPAPEPTAELRHVTHSIAHDSAVKHVTGAALYIDDLPEPAGTLHVAVGTSPAARGEILRLSLDAVRAAPAVVAVLTADDIPGANEVSPSIGGDPLFAADEVAFHGQALFAVVAETHDAARRAARLAEVGIAAERPSVTVEDAMARGETVLPDYAFGRGDAEAVIASAPHRLEGALRIGGQEHFYLEGQAALAIPGEDGSVHVHSSTQHPTEVQHIVARVLALPDAYVTCEVRRMGGGFGGKESQATQWAALAALAARVTGRACKVRLDRDDDFILTGKRHDMRSDWQVGFDEQGRILGFSVEHLARCGYSADLSQGVVDRAMLHSDNAYFLPAARIASKRLKTNTVSNTAFRGFGGPQGMMAVEHVMDRIAWALGRDPLDIRYANLYAPGRDLTPFGQRVEETATLAAIMRALEESAGYRARRREIASFNAGSPVLKRGLALTPVKFGISFTLTHLNQAGALVHVYGDGSVHMNHGGTEMGQGLHIKVAQVVAEEFGIALDRVRITATTTAKVPNTAPTAASSGTDLNAMAALNAAGAIKRRMAVVAAERLGVPESEVVFRDDRVFARNRSMGFGELAKLCIESRVQLSEAGFYRTPGLTWDRAKGEGSPFFYFAYGAACSEVLVDTTTGENRVTRIDIRHDCGRSLNPAIDIGQIEGGFVQGMGWLTTEELVFDSEGRLRTHAPSTYKIPVASDVPADFRTALHAGENPMPTIYRSKAVGEPPLMLAISVFSAIADAAQALAPGTPVRLDAPATPEAVLRACDAMRGGGR